MTIPKTPYEMLKVMIEGNRTIYQPVEVSKQDDGQIIINDSMGYIVGHGRTLDSAIKMAWTSGRVNKNWGLK